MRPEVLAVLSGLAPWCVVQADNGDILQGIPNDAFDHLVEDPPYSEHVHSKQWMSAALTAEGKPRVSSQHKELGFEAIGADEMEFIAIQAHRLVRRWRLTFCDLESTHLWAQAFSGSGDDYVRTCIWDKVDSAPQFTGDRPANGCEAIVCAHRKGRKRWNEGGRRNTFTHPVNGAEKGHKPHPTTKPLALMLELVELFTDPGDLILDPYCGSGSTGVAAIRLGRRFVGIERDPVHAAVARERLEAETRGLTLRDSRQGQTSIFDAIGGR